MFSKRRPAMKGETNCNDKAKSDICCQYICAHIPIYCTFVLAISLSKLAKPPLFKSKSGHTILLNSAH